MYYTIDTIKKGLQDNAYLPTTGIAYAVSSAINQSIPIIIEGFPGVGKQHLQKLFQK